MNGRNRFRVVGRSPHIDLGPLRANHGNTNYTAPGDADTAGIGGIIEWCRRLGVPFAQDAIALRLLRITALYRGHGVGLHSPG